MADFPVPPFGSYDALQLDGDVCVDRYSRYGAYGHGDDKEEQITGFKKPAPVNWTDVNWKDLQAKCFERNRARYNPKLQEQQNILDPSSLSMVPIQQNAKMSDDGYHENDHSSAKYQPRSAVLLRTWHNMPWTQNDIHYVRSIIMELALHSGAQYEVFLMVHVKDPAMAIFSDNEAIQRIKEQYIPPEFWDITIFFNEKLLEMYYPNVPEHT